MEENDLLALAQAAVESIDPAQANPGVRSMTQTPTVDEESQIEDMVKEEVEKILPEDSDEEESKEDSKEEAPEESEETPEEPENPPSETENTPEKQEETPEESETDTSTEALHTVKVDGEESQVSLQDLKDNYAGKQAWDQKFETLSKEREAHETQVTTFQENAKNFHELATTGKAQEALDLICELADLDRNQFVEAYVSQLAPTIAEYLELSPEQREQRALKQQADYYKGQAERIQTSQKEAQQRTQLETDTQAVMDKHGMDLNRFEELQKELIASGMENLVPETIGQYHDLVTQQDVALEVLKEINPELAKDQSALDYLMSLQKNNPGIAKEAIKARAEQAFKDQAVKALSERVAKDSKATKPKKKGKSSPKKLGKEILTFDDLFEGNIDPFDLL